MIQSRLKAVPVDEADMVNRLVDYHRHIDGILLCYDYALKTINADQPKADVFSQSRYHFFIFSLLKTGGKKLLE